MNYFSTQMLVAFFLSPSLSLRSASLQTRRRQRQPSLAHRPMASFSTNSRWSDINGTIISRVRFGMISRRWAGQPRPHDGAFQQLYCEQQRRCRSRDHEVVRASGRPFLSSAISRRGQGSSIIRPPPASATTPGLIARWRARELARALVVGHDTSSTSSSLDSQRAKLITIDGRRAPARAIYSITSAGAPATPPRRLDDFLDFSSHQPSSRV